MVDETLLLDRLEILQSSLDDALVDLKELKTANRMHQVKFWLLGFLCVAMLALTYYAWSSARDAREDLEQRFEQALMDNCETSQDARVRLRGVFQLFIAQAIETTDDPEEARAFSERFNEALLEAVPNRDCAREARDRQD